MDKRKPTETVQVPVRMQERLRAALEKAAKERGEKISLNSEVVRRLEDSFRLADMETILEDVKAKLALMAPALQKMNEAFVRADRLHEEFTLSDEDGSRIARKAELVVEARHLSGNPILLVDEALTYLAKRGNAQAKAILNELQHRTPIKPLKRA